MDADGHYLDSYLSDILPDLGLDAEAYTPYVTSFVSLHTFFVITTLYLRLTMNWVKLLM